MHDSTSDVRARNSCTAARVMSGQENKKEGQAKMEDVQSKTVRRQRKLDGQTQDNQAH